MIQNIRNQRTDTVPQLKESHDARERFGKFPLQYLSRVYHIGTMNPADKGNRGPSLEGHGLSVTTHPEAWIKIAKLGGLPIWQLGKKGGVFLNFHAMGKMHHKRLTKWAIEEGLAREKQGWQVSWYDDDLERDCAMLFLDNTQAAEEVGDNEARTLTETTLLVASDTLEQRIGFKIDPSQTFSMVAVCFAKDILMVDGVFWKDKLDVPGLSAPRGVIVPERLREWIRKEAVRTITGV